MINNIITPIIPKEIKAAEPADIPSDLIIKLPIFNIIKKYLFLKNFFFY